MKCFLMSIACNAFYSCKTLVNAYDAKNYFLLVMFNNYVTRKLF